MSDERYSWAIMLAMQLTICAAALGYAIAASNMWAAIALAVLCAALGHAVAGQNK
jgi:hypothetical protein